MRWGNLKGPQTTRHLARVKVLLGRGMRAFYLDSHISPGRVGAVRGMRQLDPRIGKQLLIFRESTNDVDILTMSVFGWYAFGDVVRPGAWDPVYLPDHSHLARLLVPDGEAFFGQYPWHILDLGKRYTTPCVAVAGFVCWPSNGRDAIVHVHKRYKNRRAPMGTPAPTPLVRTTVARNSVKS